MMISYRNPFLTESLTYKDLIADLIPNQIPGARVSKLPVRDWAPLNKSVTYQGFKNQIFKFYVKSGLNGWFTYFEFEQLDDQVRDRSINANEASRLLLWGSNLRLHCNCPSFSYHGAQYVLTQHEASIVPEDRFPIKNNPHLLGTTCKHIRSTLKVLPFHLGDIARAVKMTRSGIGTNLPDNLDPENYGDGIDRYHHIP